MKILAIFLGALAAGMIKQKYSEPADPSGSNTAEVFERFNQVINDAVNAVKEAVIPATIPAPLDSTTGGVETPTGTVTGKVYGTQYDEIIVASANRVGIDPDLLYRLLNQESRFRPDIISGKTKSNAGALGIAQFMPATAEEWLGSVKNALEPRFAIPGAARYLNWLRNQFNGDMVKAVAAYNWGVGNVKKKGLDKAPSETVAYINKVYYGVLA